MAIATPEVAGVNATKNARVSARAKPLVVEDHVERVERAIVDANRA